MKCLHFLFFLVSCSSALFAQTCLKGISQMQDNSSPHPKEKSHPRETSSAGSETEKAYLVEKYIPEEFRLHPEFLQKSLQIASVNIELIQYRTENQRTFIDVNNNYHTQTTGGVFHYKDAQNNWISIQESLTISGENATKIGVFNSDLPISVDTKSGETRMQLRKSSSDFYTFGNHTAIRFLDEHSEVLSTLEKSQEIPDAALGLSTYRLKNIFPNIDRVQEINYWSVKTDYHLQEKMVVPAASVFVELVDEVTLPIGWEITHYEGTHNTFGWQGSLAILDENQNIKGIISAAQIFDSYGSANKEQAADHLIGGAYTLVKTKNGYSIHIKMPADYFRREDLVYPVIIDPTVSNTFTTNKALQDKFTLFNANCQAVLVQTFPISSFQVTGTNTTYQIWAKGYITTSGFTTYYADKEEQRSRVGANGNWTATQFGFGTNFGPANSFYYTPANNGLWYTLNNQTIANGCYPNQNTIQYIWQGYQTFYPQPVNAVANIYGCVTNFQEMVANTWLVTTTYTAIQASVTASASICSGGNAVFSISGTGASAVVYNINGGSNSTSLLNSAGNSVVTLPNVTTTQTINLVSIALGSCSIPLTGTATVTVSPAPVAAIAAGGPLVFCQGGTVALNATVGANYTYQWFLNGTAIAGQTTDSYAATATGSYTVTITISGCSATSAATVVTVNPYPIATITPAGPTTFCQGGSVVLDAPIGAGNSYAWQLNGVVIPGQTGASYTANASGLYTVIVTATGCASTSLETSVTVNSFPGAILAVSGPTTFCAGGSVVLTAPSIPGLTYQWQSGGIAISGETNSSYTANTSGSYTAEITLNGCVSTSLATVVVVNSFPVATIAPSGPTTFCQGASVVLTANSGVGLSYQWELNGTPISGATNVSQTVSVSGDYSVTVTQNGCSVIENQLVVVNTLPTITVNNPTICPNESVVITANPTPIGGTFIWSLSVQTTNSITTTAAVTTPFTVEYTAPNGCEVIGNGILTVTTVLNGTVQVNNPSICLGEVAVLTANPTIPGGTYLWSPGGQTTPDISISPSTNSTYSVVYSLNGCSAVSVDGTVTVNTPPLVSFSADNLTGCSPLNVTFTSTGAPASFYSWNMGDGTQISGAIANTTFTTAGCYDITLTATENGCTGSQTLVNYICVNPVPEASFSTNISTFTENTQTVIFSNNTIGGQTYNWNFNDGTSPSTQEEPQHSFSNTLEGYTITLIAYSGACLDEFSLFIPYQEELLFFVPNTFTPDNDFYNPTFQPVFTSGFDPYDYTLSLYNRWGELIFVSQNAAVGWNGTFGATDAKICQEGIYTWKVEFKVLETDERKMFSGHVNLMR
jgi:gliding motility-associated-like protein